MATPLALAVLIPVAATCGDAVAPESTIAIAEAESGRNPFAIYDNTTRRSYSLNTLEEAVALARSLLASKHSLDLGLMQINSANFSWTGLTVTTAFDPCESIRASQKVLVAAYQRCSPGRDQDAALRCMASYYNTGTATRGLTNGYVARLWRVAERMVPPIRDAGLLAAPPASVESSPPPSIPAEPEPPSWDVWRRAERRTSPARTPALPRPSSRPAAPPPSPTPSAPATARVAQLPDAPAPTWPTPVRTGTPR